MCGILGYYHETAHHNDDIKSHLKTLAHRGPDASGVYHHNNIFLGHQRLSIIDLSASANQPFQSIDQRYTLIYNGEIYNYRELIKKYALPVRTQSDTEVILQLFIQLGEKFVHELNGMFAFAIYDSFKDELFLYRDRIGIKPLYYRIGDNGFSFASELPALFFEGEDVKINNEALLQFLHLGYIPEPLTLYNGTFKFPAGTYACYKDGKLNFTTYWTAEEQVTAHTISSEKQVIDEVHELLSDAVKIRMHADVPFGTFLSGGTDSGLISAIAADLSAEPINTFNVSFEDAVFDETPYAAQMAKIIGSHHFNFKISRQQVLNSLNEGIKLVGEPFADSSIFPTMAISRFASTKVKMILSGDGGDELFLGYGAYNWAKRLANPVIWHSRKLIAALLRHSGKNRFCRAANVFYLNRQTDLITHIASQEQNLFSSAEITRLFKKPFSFVGDIRFDSLPRNFSPAEKQAFFDLNYYLKDDLLVKVDRSSMRFGLEVRVPFLDHRLVGYSLNIDPKLKTKASENKYILKKILEKYYPDHLIYRKKYGFSIPLEKWLREMHQLQQVKLPENLKKEYDVLFQAYQENNNQKYLYNRLYALKCLSAFLS